MLGRLFFLSLIFPSAQSSLLSLWFPLSLTLPAAQHPAGMSKRPSGLMRVIQRGYKPQTASGWPLGSPPPSPEGQYVYSWPQGVLAPSQRLLGSSSASPALESGGQRGPRRWARLQDHILDGHGVLGPADLFAFCGSPVDKLGLLHGLAARHLGLTPLLVDREAVKTRGKRCGASGKQQKRLLEERLRDLQKLRAMEAAAQAEGEDGSRERAPLGWQLPTQYLGLSPQTPAPDLRQAAAPHSPLPPGRRG